MKLVKYVPTEKEMDGIIKSVEKEFPDDNALQEVHIARRVIELEAKHNGMDSSKYLLELSRRSFKQDNR